MIEKTSKLLLRTEQQFFRVDMEKPIQGQPCSLWQTEIWWQTEILVADRDLAGVLNVGDLPTEINVADTKSLCENGEDFLLLDCRNQNEYDLGHIDGCTFIAMPELQERLAEIQEYRTKRVIVYCHIGGRSFQVTQWLRTQGFTQAQSMAGGIDAWSEQIDGRLPRY